MRLEMKRAAESVQRPLLLTWPLRLIAAKVNIAYGSFASISSRRNRCIISRLMFGNGGRSDTFLRRIDQFAQFPYSGCRLASRAYRFLAQSEFFKISANPIGNMTNAPGPGSGPSSGATTTKVQPRISIHQRKALRSRQGFCLLPVMRSMWWRK